MVLFFLIVASRVSVYRIMGMSVCWLVAQCFLLESFFFVGLEFQCQFLVAIKSMSTGLAIITMLGGAVSAIYYFCCTKNMIEEEYLRRNTPDDERLVL